MIDRYDITAGNIGHIIRNIIWQDQDYVPPITRKSILKAADVSNITKMYKNKKLMYRGLAKKYHVSKHTIWKVINKMYEITE